MYTTTIANVQAIASQAIQGHTLYIIREDLLVFSVGKSLHPLERFLEHLGQGQRPTVPSRLGIFLQENAPVSSTWIYDLLKPEEYFSYAVQLTGRQDIPFISTDDLAWMQELATDSVEELLIELLRPRPPHNMLYADGESKLAQGLANCQVISYTRS